MVPGRSLAYEMTLNDLERPFYVKLRFAPVYLELSRVAFGAWLLLHSYGIALFV